MPSYGLKEGKRSIVVVYERHSGDIVHVHEVVTERGCKHPATRTVEREAFELACEGKLGRTLGRKQMAALSVQPSRFQPDSDSMLRVDVKRCRLERIPIRPMGC